MSLHGPEHGTQHLGERTVGRVIRPQRERSTVVEVTRQPATTGSAHIGAIRGVSTSIGLAASALGPYALAVGVDLAGGFAAPALWFTIIPAGVLIAGVLVRPPRPVTDTEPVKR